MEKCDVYGLRCRVGGLENSLVHNVIRGAGRRWERAGILAGRVSGVARSFRIWRFCSGNFQIVFKGVEGAASPLPLI